jgi:Tol biopolymer transport system component
MTTHFVLCDQPGGRGDTEEIAMRYLFGFLCVCALGIVLLVGCDEANTFECSNFSPQVTANGREVIYGRNICEPCEVTWSGCDTRVVDSYLLVHDVETRVMAQLPLNSWAFDVSSDGDVIAYTSNPGFLKIYERGSGNATSVDVAEFGSHLASPRISGDGQVVAFTIVLGDGDYAIFVYDRATEQTERATTQPRTGLPSLSNDGRFLAYQTSQDNLDLEIIETAIHVLDRANGQSTLVSVNSDGEPGNAPSFDPVISGDGRFVVFRSSATNLVTPSASPPDLEGLEVAEVYVHDRETGATSLVSAAADSGEPSGSYTVGDSASPQDISTDGQFVVYMSGAENIVPVEGEASVPVDNVYRHDAGIDRTTRVSINSLGGPADGFMTHPSVSDDGRFIAFGTSSTNLDPDDVDSDQDIYLHDVRSGETRWVSER